MISRKGDITILGNNVLTAIIAVFGLFLLFAGVVKLYYVFIDQESENAKRLINSLEAKINNLEDGETGKFLIKGQPGWFLTGWSKGEEGRPDKCFFESCLCICRGRASDVFGEAGGFLDAVIISSLRLVDIANNNYEFLDRQKIVNKNKNRLCSSSEGFCRKMDKNIVSTRDITIKTEYYVEQKDMREAYVSFIPFERSNLYELVVEKSKEGIIIKDYLESYYKKLLEYNKWINDVNNRLTIDKSLIDKSLIEAIDKMMKERFPEVKEKTRDSHDEIIRDLKLLGKTDQEIVDLFKEVKEDMIQDLKKLGKNDQEIADAIKKLDLDISLERVEGVRIISDTAYLGYVRELFKENNLEVSDEALSRGVISSEDSTKLIENMKKNGNVEGIVELVYEYGVDISKEGARELNLMEFSVDEKKIVDIFNGYGFSSLDERFFSMLVLKNRGESDERILGYLEEYGMGLSPKRISAATISENDASNIIKKMKVLGKNNEEIITWFKIYRIAIPKESMSELGGG